VAIGTSKTAAMVCEMLHVSERSTGWHSWDDVQCSNDQGEDGKHGENGIEAHILHHALKQDVQVV